MGQIKTRLAALLLALVMLLSGCGESTGESSANSPPPAESGTPSEISKEPGLSGSSSESQDELSAEEKRLIARMGLEEAETRELTGEHMNEIKESVASMRAAYVAGPGGKDPLVEERDWSVYTSGIGEENLSNQEAVLYRRLDKLCLSYLESSALSGVKCQFSNGNVWDVTDTVSYGDLGLSSEQAKRVAYWFKWNHPQYYFIGNGSATYSNSEICLRMYHLMVNGEKRAKITNQLFDKLDGWIEDVNSRASTTYEKELLANKLLCEQNIYERQYENPPDGGLPYDQSLYSVVLLGKTVCAGYALGFCAMMNAMNIETTVALSITHAWNVVRFDDGNHYAVDVCWNDTDSTPAYVNKYLNIGERIMSETNSRRESHTYEKPYDAWIPAIAKESYNPEEDDSQQASDGLRNLRIQESSSTSVTLAWDEAAGSHINHRHRFEAAVFTDTSRSEILYSKKVYETSFTFEPLNPNTSYEFGIRFYCNRDNYASEWTCLTVTTAGGEPEKLTTLPSNIETVYQDTTQAHSSWSSGIRSTTTSEVCQYTDSTYTQMKEGYPQFLSNNQSGHNWTGLEEGKTYYFGIRLTRKFGVERVYSDWVNFSYTHGSAEVPSGGEALAAPINIRPMSLYISKSSARIAWDKVSGATGYEVNIYEDAEHSGEPQIVQVTTGNTFSLRSLEVGTTYYLSIRAVKNDAGQTVYSEWVDYSYRHIGHS